MRVFHALTFKRLSQFERPVVWAKEHIGWRAKWSACALGTYERNSPNSVRDSAMPSLRSLSISAAGDGAQAYRAVAGWVGFGHTTRPDKLTRRIHNRPLRIEVLARLISFAEEERRSSEGDEKTRFFASTGISGLYNQLTRDSLDRRGPGDAMRALQVAELGHARGLQSVEVEAM